MSTSQPEEGDSPSIKEMGWRQGSSLPPSLFERLKELTGLEFVEGQHVAIVCSQDCDVVHPSIETEPRVEIVRGTLKPSVDGNLTYGKSARKLHLKLDDVGGEGACELSIHERREIDRNILKSTAPADSPALSDNQKRQLAGWLAKRYRREAFPDALSDRLKQKPASANFRKLLREFGKWVSSIHVILDTDEDLLPEQSYAVVVYALVPAGYHHMPQIRKQLDDTFQPALERVLSEFDGIQASDVMVVSESDFTVDDQRNSRRLDLDELSYRDEAPMAADV